eukprot:GEMP01060670.1.p1 GENE.GEMP01060670.1~~GEMP01060670.1.p1  ORF type:complete len:130 (+),score=4.46 GEMP01060670.1:191-580(+)
MRRVASREGFNIMAKEKLSRKHRNKSHYKYKFKCEGFPRVKGSKSLSHRESKTFYDIPVQKHHQQKIWRGTLIRSHALPRAHTCSASGSCACDYSKMSMSIFDDVGVNTRVRYVFVSSFVSCFFKNAST